MAMSSSSEINTMFVVENVPEMDTTKAAMDKKKKKKEKSKGVDIEDMYSFDVDKLEKVKPVKKKKETTDSGSGQITLAHLQNTMKFMAMIEEKNKPKQTEQEQAEGTRSELPLGLPADDEIQPTEAKKIAEVVEEKDKALLRFPSPSRSRQSSPKKRDESPQKASMNASAAAFVPPSITSPAKETVASGLKASATEFVPPGFNSLTKTTTSLQASASEFVPPEVQLKPRSEAGSEAPSETCWAHALLPPAPNLSSKPVASYVEQLPTEKTQPAKVVVANCVEQLPTEKTKPAKVPALTLNFGAVSNSATEGTSNSDAVIDDNDAKWTARLDVGSILGKVQKSLTASITGTKLTPNPAVDPCAGKVLDKVRRIEEKEADNEAEKEREAAIKAVQKREEQDAETKKAQAKMDETLMDCFLQAVKTRVKDHDLPIMGTTLYGKHMRAARRIGSSCDVKDSSFVWLRPFLESLEEEGLLKLKPEVKDPTVTWINRNHHLMKTWKPWAFKDTVGSQKACGPTTRR